MIAHMVDCVVALAALVAILDYFGIKPKRPLWGILMPLSRNWKLGIMLTLVAASLGMSGYGIYHSLRPKVVEKTVTVTVEKPVDRIVEKIVQAECPKPQTTARPVGHSKPKAPSQPVPFSQNCPNGICSGGDNLGTQTVNNFTPPERHASPAQQQALNTLADSLPADAKRWFTVESVNDQECITYGDEIQRIFKAKDKTDAGVVVWISAHPPLPRDVVVVVSGPQDVHFQAAQDIANALVAMGIPGVQLTGQRGIQEGKVKVIVGKPSQ